MAWPIERIREEWLGGPSGLAMADDELVELFNTVESTFGPDWVESQRRLPGATGTSPTLRVATAGELIRASDGLPGRHHVLTRLRNDEPGTRSELLTLAAIRRSSPSIAIELEPVVTVGAANRSPDLGLLFEGNTVFVEVSQPQTSQASDEVSERVRQLAMTALQATPMGSSSEIYLHETPSDEDALRLLEVVRRLCADGGERRECGDIANVVVNHSTPLTVQPFDHGDEPRPRISVAQFELSGDQARHALVRHPFTDERAARLLAAEARQLPVESPGIVVLHIDGTASGLVAWERLLRPRLQPARHTRVSAIVLLQSGLVALPDGEAWGHRARIIENDHARHRCPDWALHPFRHWEGEDFHALP